MLFSLGVHYVRTNIYAYICNSACEKGPSYAFFQNRVIATVSEEYALSYKMHYIFSDESKVLQSHSH